MTYANPANLTGSAKRQVAVGDVKPWPEIVFQVKFHDPLWKWLLIIPVLAGLVMLGYHVSAGALYRLLRDDRWVIQSICEILLLLLGAAEVVVLARILLRTSWFNLREKSAVMHGLGDVCVLRDVKKTGWRMQMPEQLRALNIIAIEGGFRNRKNIGRLILPNCTERLADGLLKGCKHLACIHLPDRLKVVPPSLLEKCARLQAVVLPASAESIGARAFAGCKRLKDVYITAATTEIAEDAFAGCPKVFFHVQEASAAEQFARRHNINYSYH